MKGKSMSLVSLRIPFSASILLLSLFNSLFLRCFPSLTISLSPRIPFPLSLFYLCRPPFVQFSLYFSLFISTSVSFSLYPHSISFYLFISPSLPHTLFFLQTDVLLGINEIFKFTNLNYLNIHFETKCNQCAGRLTYIS